MAEAILETADSLHRVGAMDDETHASIIMRHGGNSTGAVADQREGPSRENPGTTAVRKER